MATLPAWFYATVVTLPSGPGTLVVVPTPRLDDRRRWAFLIQRIHQADAEFLEHARREDRAQPNLPWHA